MAQVNATLAVHCPERGIAAARDRIGCIADSHPVTRHRQLPYRSKESGVKLRPTSIHPHITECASRRDAHSVMWIHVRAMLPSSANRDARSTVDHACRQGFGLRLFQLCSRDPAGYPEALPAGSDHS